MSMAVDMLEVKLEVYSDDSQDDNRLAPEHVPNNSVEPDDLAATNARTQSTETGDDDSKTRIRIRNSITESFPCSHCDKVFSCRLHLSKHMVSIFGKKVCKYCSKGCVSIEALEAHMRTKHDPEEPYECEFCQKTFCTQKECDEHALSHRNRLPYECGACRERFSERRAHRRHLRTHKLERTLLCTDCGKRFISKKLLRAHKLVHDDVPIYMCDVCRKTFTRKTSLTLHMRIHWEVKPFVCVVCDKGFVTRNKLAKHAGVHAPGHLSHVCHVCFYTFPSRYHLGRHLITHKKEGISTEFDSNTLLSKFEQNSYYQRSYATDVGEPARYREDEADGDVKVYTMEETQRCEQVIIGGAAWVEHQATHDAEEAGSQQQYQCEICEKIFKQSYYLKLHLRTHTGERPYGCAVCDKRFTTSSKLTRHMQVHSTVKEHRCIICEKSFGRPSYLRVHLARHDRKAAKKAARQAAKAAASSVKS